MECKGTRKVILFMILFGINRNIMECKDEIQNSLPEEVWRINRNIMECKVKKIV